jgi:UDP-N-acetylmuramoyl-tripeptide--D-alanyl-D-alanine ligase
MKFIWNSKDLSLALNQEVRFEANSPQFNSKSVQPGDFFIALKGNSDGHNYIKDAIDNGAIFGIASNIPTGLSQEYAKKVVLVDDPYHELLNLAKFRRNQSKAKFIAITGSSGKTSTKTYLAKILENFDKTFSTQGNFNNHIGAPLSLASIPLDSKYAVIEIGTNHPGEINPIAQIVKPDISIITNISASHIGNFASLEDIAKEKGEIFQGPIGLSTAIIHKESDNEIFKILKNSATSLGVKNILTFGEYEKNDARILNYELVSKNVASIKFNLGGMIYQVNTSLTGQHNALNLLAIALTTSCLDLHLERVLDLFEKFEPLDGRGNTHSIKKFGISFEIIDDSYNANPKSMQAALSHFANLKSNQKVAILGDMLELGDDAQLYHKELAADLNKAGVYKFVAVGPLMKNLFDHVEGVEKLHFPNYESLMNEISTIIKDQDVVLLKSSHGSNLHKIISYLRD